jgi:hypothetical protein
MGEYHVSQASQKYQQGEGKERKTMEVEIIDGSYVPMVYAPFEIASRIRQESTSGYQRGLKVSGHPAFVDWKKKSERVNLSVLVSDRFLVTIKGRKVDEGTGEKWAKLLDVKQLEALADKAKPKDVTEPED